MKSKIPIVICVDFDGTIATHAYPDLGKPRPGAVTYLRKLKREGYYIIIWSCRTGTHTQPLIDWLTKYKIPFDLINEQHPILLEHYKDDARKVLGDIYVDDRNAGGIPDHWKDLYQIIKKHSRELRTKALDIIKTNT